MIHEANDEPTNIFPAVPPARGPWERLLNPQLSVEVRTPDLLGSWATRIAYANLSISMQTERKYHTTLEMMVALAFTTTCMKSGRCVGRSIKLEEQGLVLGVRQQAVVRVGDSQ